MISGSAVGSIATGLASRLITSGFQRVGSLIFQKAMRISKIEQTFKTSAQRNPHVKVAVDDFEALIGNRYGELSEQLANFIEELERSGLITALVAEALLDRRSPEVQHSFVNLHSRA